MGNMLESDSSSSDIENVEAQEIIRTEGDGMEFIKDSLVESNMTSKPSNSTENNQITSNSTNSGTKGVDGSGGIEVQGAIETVQANTRVIATLADESQECNTSILSRSPSTVSSDSQNLKQTFRQVDFRKVIASSPNQLPARDLLIPVKAVKCEAKVGKKSASSGADSDKSPQGANKQKNAKFVPYEPYACAVRPMVPVVSKHRKSSESSSVASQSSVQSSRNATPTFERKTENIVVDLKTGVGGVTESTAYSSSSTTSERSPSLSSTAQGNANNHHNNHSSVLLRERLKMAEKEILDLQSENAKLKKLLLDSMTVSTNSSTNASYADNGNSNHDQKESFDNLTDEIEVWRSKFLSSCVLVEQLTRDNQMLNDSINFACEVLQDLKNTLPLTPLQYEVVSEWLRKNRMMSTSFGSSNRQPFDSFSEPKQD